MVLKCVKCDKKFKDKSRYQKHIKDIQCDKKYECPDCGNDFKKPGNLARHRDRVTPCVIPTDTINTKTSTEFECKCGTTFTTKSNMNRHQKKCDYKSANTLILNMAKDMKAMREELRELKRGTTINNTIINNDNRSITYTTVKLKPYGQEDLEKLDINIVKGLLMNNPEKYNHSMIQLIHANPNLLENHNIYYNKDSDEIMVYTSDEKWKSRSTVSTTSELTHKAISYLKSHPIPQNIPRGSIEETIYEKNMHIVLHQKDWNSHDSIANIKEVLSINTDKPDFIQMVEFQNINN